MTASHYLESSPIKSRSKIMAYDANEFHPIKVIRQGDLSASIYRAIGRNGPFYSTEINRVGQHNGQLRVTNHYLTEHVLPLSNLATRAFNHIAYLKSKDQEAAHETKTPEIG